MTLEWSNLPPRFEFPAWLKHPRERAMLMPQISIGGIHGAIAAGAVGVAQAVDSTLLYDTFTDSDGVALPSHTIAPTNTLGATWAYYSAGSPQFLISSNKAYRGSGGGRNDICYVDALRADCTIECDMRLASGGGKVVIELALRCSGLDAGLSLYFYYGSATNNVSLYRMDTIASYGDISYSLSYNTTYAVKVILSGSSVAWYMNNSLVYTWTSVTYNQSATKFGFTQWGADTVPNPYATWDNFKISA